MCYKSSQLTLISAAINIAHIGRTAFTIAVIASVPVSGYLFINSVPTQPGQRPVTTWVYKPEAANQIHTSIFLFTQKIFQVNYLTM